MNLAPLVLPVPGFSNAANDVRFVVIDAHTNTACAATFTTIGSFDSDDAAGFIAAALGDNALWGYINQRGEWLIAPTFTEARSFSEDGLARVLVGDCWGYINKKCAFVIAPQYADAGAFSCGLAAVRTAKNKWCYIDATGATAIAGPFAIAQNFSACGLAAAANKSRQQFGYINRQGEWQIAPRFNTLLQFSDAGVAPACEDKLYGLIDTQGKWILQPKYSGIREFNKDGLAFFDEINSWDNGHGYLDASGNVVIKSGRHLSNAMIKGITRAEYTGSQYLTITGANLSEEYFSWGEHFSQFGVAIARTRDRDAGNFPSNRWGFINADGSFNLLSDICQEPLTDSDGWIRGFRHDTALAPFLAHDGTVAYVSPTGATSYCLVFDAEKSTMTLHDAQQAVVWTSINFKAQPTSFFNPTPAHFAEDANCLGDGIVGVAQQMLLEAESKLQRFIAGEEVASTENDDDDASEDNNDSKNLTVRRRIVRAYLDENQYSSYDFMYERYGDVVAQMQATMRAKLSEQFGASDPDPETPAIDRYASENLDAWCTTLKTPVNRASSAFSEDNQLWLALYGDADSGDGDAWHELWLLAAPSIDALIAAQNVRGKIVAGHVDSDDIAAPAEGTPTTSDEWLTAVVADKYALLKVPPTMLDDAIVNAAIGADAEAFEYIPAQYQTRERLLKLVNTDARTAADIPEKCMTREALTLARQLYEDDETWGYVDGRNKLTTDAKWDHNSLYNVWGADLSEAHCIKAIKAGVGLRNIPLWLRSDKIEALAIEKDICNIAELAPEKITAEMANRAVLETYSNLIEHIPAALQTEALCIKSAKAHGASLEFIPQPLRTLAVCVAALKQERNAFIHVPDAIQLEVVNALIAHALAKPDEDAEQNGGTYWHYPRAWIKLHHLEDAQGALDDATLAIPHARCPVYAHYLRAAALRTLGRTREAALEAAVVLSMSDDFTDEFSADIDTSWLNASLKTGFDETTDAQLLAEMHTRPLALASVPRHRITSNMVDVAVAADIEAVQFVPKRLMTPSLYAMAVKSRNKRFSSIPSHMLSEAACLEEIQNSGYSLRNIPDKFRTVAVCTAALADNSSALKYIPEAIRAEVQTAVGKMPVDDDEGEKSSWVERKVFENILAGNSGNKTVQKFGFLALILGGVAKGAFTPSPEPATLHGYFGLLGWLERRSIVAVLLNSLLACIALGLHVWVTVAAWLSHGALVGIATGVLMGISEVIWAIRFWFYSPTQIGMGFVALFVALYVLVYRTLHTKVAVAIAAKAQDD